MSTRAALPSTETTQWAGLMRDQLSEAGFNEQTPVPYYAITVPGEKLDPNKPKPPLFMPVTKPTEQFTKEHGPYGRYDPRSQPAAVAAAAKYNIQTTEQEDGLPETNDVFHTELLTMQSHFGLRVPSIMADAMIKHEFSISNRFTQATQNQTETEKKLSEIATTIKNTADRAGMDVEHIESKQWAAIFRWSESLVIGSVKLPNYQINVIGGSLSTRFPGDKMEPFATLHSIAAQTNNRPIMESTYGEPAAIHLEVLER